jgi:hypothetical protein
MLVGKENAGSRNKITPALGILLHIMIDPPQPDASDNIL